LDEIRTRAPGYPHLPENSPTRSNTTVAFANEGVYPYSAFNTTFHSYGNR
jgi:hypothetical protein